MEFVGINKFSPDAFVARVDFQTEIGTGEKKASFNHLNFISANTSQGDATVAVPVISTEEDPDTKYVVLVGQFRPVIGETTYELPRGFTNPDDFVGSKPIANALRELDEETGIVSESQGRIKVTHVGESFENTGTHNVVVNIERVDVRVSAVEMEKISHRVTTEDTGHQLKTLLVPIDRAINIASDNHSKAALAATLYGN